ncbi:site-specific integrase [Micromonospora sp. NBC_01699]|uniref:tyrosine-type recombinase/integrase n=1 Tax=Micromonospora sp. NBC_01699 TaxID=2975984 RepID=UPI002E35C33E|nr:tyrosine-type recombinase/integrase [Micromonospora sp. NBC_01699]
MDTASHPGRAADNPHDAIFASRRGTWLSPNNVHRQWRQARADADLAWVTPHTFRKTVATLIREETDTKSAAAQLGHSSEEVTDMYYIAKLVQAPDLSEILERLSANHPCPARNDPHG